MNHKLIIISGPTASGKTSLSLKLAKKIDVEIINFDSLLFYKELSIGVAKPSDEEIQSCPHHFVSSTSILEEMNAHLYSKQAIELINEIIKKGKTPILVGGSGFYLQAVLQGMYESTTSDASILKKSQKLYKEKGVEPFRDILREVDTESFDKYHENDHYRIMRAVEYFWTNNSPISLARKTQDKENIDRSSWPSIIHQWNPLHIHLDLPKDEHYEYIKKRTKLMIQSGLIQEVADLLHRFPKNLKPLQSIGYKESIDFLEGKFSNIDEFEERINISTRQLAKSQRTWFKKKEKLTFHPVLEVSKIISLVL